MLDALDRAGAADRTLVLFTSDNGCAPYIGVPEMEAKGHFPSGSPAATRATHGRAGIACHSSRAGPAP
ncbi:MAG: hypothetical protein U1G05_07825 [Kiritimatiellia bacterium]